MQLHSFQVRATRAEYSDPPSRFRIVPMTKRPTGKLKILAQLADNIFHTTKAYRSAPTPRPRRAHAAPTPRPPRAHAAHADVNAN